MEQRLYKKINQNQRRESFQKNKHILKIENDV